MNRNYYFKKLNLPASSLMYAVFVSVIIAIVIGSMLLLENLYNQVENTYVNQILLQQESDNYFSQALNGEIINIQKSINVETKDVEWGMFNVLTCQVSAHKDTIYKEALTGAKNYRYNDLALYLTDNNNPLKLAGKTEIKGNMQISDLGVKIMSINKSVFTGDYCSSCIKQSQKTLPKIRNVKVSFGENPIQLTVEQLVDEGITYNSFNQPTIVVHAISKSLHNLTLQGNFILVGKDSLSVSKSCKLNDIIIKASTVHIENGFNGSFQVFSSKNIYVDDNVTLRYPTVLFLQNEGKGGIEIKSNSQVSGAVIVAGNNSMFDRFRYISLEKRSTIIGQIYCNGKIQLKGKVYGSILANSFFLDTKETKYDNALLDAEINNKDFPEKYGFSPLFLSDLNYGRLLIKYL